ncbi:sulfite exporter TauE/SafE family protein [Pistricoccus aurantiacus]|uniref:Probable membrane transporter protein n=1 Tax=Pistricoccus aurantiacus TaxID=1883414 RepID=A0A5B8SLI8_9GAMM|nr:sulfite exporter TauE/SafE family protein [Pistricoccus aurantiacus]QEA37616.1 sulfite exporter TauE/SafE family protein [Pistricoccus aurantiacus]
MSIETLGPYLLVAFVAGYFQTVTGFGLGMIVIGVTSALGIASVATVAAVVSLMTLVNSAVALPGKLQHVHWPAAGAVIVALVPSILAGVLLLGYLSESASTLLRLALGAIIIYGGASLIMRPSRQGEPSGKSSFFVSGLLSGLCGGLFGIAGPPLIYQCYRQPFSLISIRNMLIMFFAISALMRTLFVGWQGGLDAQVLLLTAWGIPLIALATYLGRRFPPPLSARTMRRLVFLVLLGIGASLILPELGKLLA